jgi:hypothetical protein
MHNGLDNEAIVSRAPSNCISLARVTNSHAFTASIKALFSITQSNFPSQLQIRWNYYLVVLQYSWL